MSAAADRRFMALALALAERGLGNVWPNPAVGCVLVKDGRVVGRGWTQPGGRPHAESEAIARAGAASRPRVGPSTQSPACGTSTTSGVSPSSSGSITENGTAISTEPYHAHRGSASCARHARGWARSNAART